MFWVTSSTREWPGRKDGRISFPGWCGKTPSTGTRSGTDGEEILEFDLEQNVPVGDAPGYWSEFSVHSILWDLADDLSDAGDNTRIDATTLWRAFTGLNNDRFVYLPAFLDRLVQLVPSESLGIEQIVRGRSIDYRAGAQPSIADPLPRLVSGADAVTGEVDSLSRQRANLAQSAHQYGFDVARSGRIVASRHHRSRSGWKPWSQRSGSVPDGFGRSAS